MSDRVWTEEEIKRLVPEYESDPKFFGDADEPLLRAFLQTRLDLENARNDMIDGAMKFDDKVIECVRLHAALERLEGLSNAEISDYARDIIRKALTTKGADDER